MAATTSRGMVLLLLCFCVVTGCAQNDLPGIPTPAIPTPTTTAPPTAQVISQVPSPLPPEPTATATRTVAPTPGLPTATIAPTAPRLTPTVPWPQCLSNKEAPAHIGENTCVQATVYGVNQTESAYFIDFDAGRSSFYAVSFTLTKDRLPLVKGQCIRIRGRIDTYNDRPQLVIRTLDQVASC